MSNLVVLLGESGTGKSTSMRTLNPESTFIINVLNKPLPFRGYKKLYNEERKNYLESDSASKIIQYIGAINERRPDIKTIIIDDFNFITNNEYMRRCQENGFRRFNDIGKNMFDFFQFCLGLREDLTCFILCHTELNQAGMLVPQTIGKMTSDYVGIEKRLTIILHSLIMDNEYKFLTQNDGLHMAKSPMGMFDRYIDNDLLMIKTTIDDYYGFDEVGEE